MLNLCHDKHEEVCHEYGAECPACEVITELRANIKELEATLADARETIANRQSQLTAVHNQLAECDQHVRELESAG